jgi:hypothetical protein
MFYLGLGVPLYTFMPLPDGGVMAEISLASCGVIARGGGKNNQEVRWFKQVSFSSMFYNFFFQ